MNIRNSVFSCTDTLIWWWERKYFPNQLIDSKVYLPKSEMMLRTHFSHDLLVSCAVWSSSHWSNLYIYIWSIVEGTLTKTCSVLLSFDLCHLQCVFPREIIATDMMRVIWTNRWPSYHGLLRQGASPWCTLLTDSVRRACLLCSGIITLQIQRCRSDKLSLRNVVGVSVTLRYTFRRTTAVHSETTMF